MTWLVQGLEKMIETLSNTGMKVGCTKRILVVELYFVILLFTEAA